MLQLNSSFKQSVKSLVLSYEQFTNSRFYKLRAETNGMLLPIVYRKMYDLCSQLPDLDIIEVGGATGTGSVALAWALKDQQKQSKLIVVEKCEGGTRVDVGGYAENLQLINSHFSKFGVSEQIRLFPKELTFNNGNEAISLIQTPQLAAFVHDADGRIDRDFFLFWPLLCEGGLIIIDDYANEANYQPISERHPLGGAKLILTYRLLNQIIKWGLFKPTHKIGKTIFGIKPSNADFSRFDLATCAKIVDEIEAERQAYLASQKIPVSAI